MGQYDPDPIQDEIIRKTIAECDGRPISFRRRLPDESPDVFDEFVTYNVETGDVISFAGVFVYGGETIEEAIRDTKRICSKWDWTYVEPTSLILEDQRARATAALEEIAMFAEGQAGDRACAELKELGVWSRKVENMDGRVMTWRHLAHRGSDVEAFIKRARDRYESSDEEWFGIDRLLDEYRLHADTGTPLDQEAVDGGDREP